MLKSGVGVEVVWIGVSCHVPLNTLPREVRTLPCMAALAQQPPATQQATRLMRERTLRQELGKAVDKAEELMLDHRQRLRKKKVEFVNFKLFNKEESHENKNKYVESQIENAMKYFKTMIVVNQNNEAFLDVEKIKK